MYAEAMPSACSIRVRGVVQGVGFRPFVYRLAIANALTGWVVNGEHGVEIHAEGEAEALRAFVSRLRTETPPAASVAELAVVPVRALGLSDFSIRDSHHDDVPTVRVSPDLPVCEQCRAELQDPSNTRYRYPYINCTNCGPRYSVILSLPYDRPNTTMKEWPLDEFCQAEYHDPANRRFHAQPVACPRCGPRYYLETRGGRKEGWEAVVVAADALRAGAILAVKGIGGYHLACDARNEAAVQQLRERKYRKEKPFAVMAKNLEVVRELINLTPAAEKIVTSIARPIVLAPEKMTLRGIAPENHELGVMLPYTPLHSLLFQAGAPNVLVMTSANRSSEPIAYEDEDARETLAGITDSFLIGERPIARRVEDSVARVGAFGPVILRRSRGYAPGAVASLALDRPLLAVGADLKNSITLVVEGQAFASQHMGDLNHYGAYRAFEETIRDLLAMYELRMRDLVLAHDAHPQYRSTLFALGCEAHSRTAVQHHRAHIASVLAERGAWDTMVVGASFDGTGFGDDGSIWGGEVFVGSVQTSFERVAHLRPAALPGGDAAAEHPVQAAAGFLSQVEDLPDLSAAPFHFPPRYYSALGLVERNLRTFATTSVGRLFDTAAALLGFTREISFEGQAAMWLEHQARRGTGTVSYPFPFRDGQLDYRPLLMALVQDRARGQDDAEVARSFHRGIAQGLGECLSEICRKRSISTVVLSGGVFQNDLLLQDLKEFFAGSPIVLWTNSLVPPNDGGISLGQAALAAFDHRKSC